MKPNLINELSELFKDMEYFKGLDRNRELTTKEFIENFDKAFCSRFQELIIKFETYAPPSLEFLLSIQTHIALLTLGINHKLDDESIEFYKKINDKLISTIQGEL